MSGILSFTLAEPKKKTPKAAPVPAGTEAPKKARKAPAPKVPAGLQMDLKLDGDGVVLLTNPAGWTFRLTPKVLRDYTTSWSTVLGISQSATIENIEITVGDKSFMKMRTGGYLQVHDMVSAFSLLSL